MWEKTKKWLGGIIAGLMAVVAIVGFVFFVFFDKKKGIKKQQKHIDELRREDKQMRNNVIEMKKKLKDHMKEFDDRFDMLKKEGENIETENMDFDTATNIIDKLIHTNGDGKNIHTNGTTNGQSGTKDNKTSGKDS